MQTVGHLDRKVASRGARLRAWISGSIVVVLLFFCLACRSGQSTESGGGGAYIPSGSGSFTPASTSSTAVVTGRAC